MPQVHVCGRPRRQPSIACTDARTRTRIEAHRVVSLVDKSVQESTAVAHDAIAGFLQQRAADSASSRLRIHEHPAQNEMEPRHSLGHASILLHQFRRHEGLDDRRSVQVSAEFVGHREHGLRWWCWRVIRKKVADDPLATPRLSENGVDVSVPNDRFFRSAVHQPDRVSIRELGENEALGKAGALSSLHGDR